MFSAKLFGSLLLAVTIVSGITIAILSKVISKQQNEIRTLEKTISSYEVDLKTEKENVSLLEGTVNDLNKQIKSYKAKSQEAIDNYNRYLSQRQEDRVSEKLKEVLTTENKEDNECANIMNKLNKLQELTLEDF